MSSVTESLVHNSQQINRNKDYFTDSADNGVLDKLKTKRNFKFICGLAIIFAIVATVMIGLHYFGFPNTSSSAGRSISFYEEGLWTEIDHIEETDRFRRKLWEEEETCSDDTTFTMKLLPVLKNVDKLHEMLMEVSDPNSPKYGEYYDIEYINHYFGASAQSLGAIYEWLDTYGFDVDKIKKHNVQYGGDMIEFETTCGTASSMLNTEYVVWKHVATGDFSIGVRSSYYVPESLSYHIDLIGPTLRFPLRYSKRERIKVADTYYIGKQSDIDNVVEYMQHIEPKLKAHLKESRLERNKKMVKHQKRVNQDSDFTYVYPDVLWELYSMEDYKDSADTSYDNKQAFGSWLSEYTMDSDTEEFDEEWSITFDELERIPSNQSSSDAGYEASLDLQYITTTGQNIYTQEWYTSDESSLWIITFLIKLRKQYLTSDSDLPYVVSMSYGAVESESGETLVKKANTLFGTLSGYGITFLAATGDDGAAGDGDCDGEFSPDFPAACPYVTAVGGVYGGSYPVDDSSTDEEAWYYGGGGFSNYFSRSEYAEWQDDAVDYWINNYADELVADSSWYNSSGRGYPDISAQSYYFLVVDDGEWWLVSGTSASCPTVAGQIALLNDLRLQNNQSTIGLLNPKLYNMYDELDYYINDVTTGYNEGCSDTDDVGYYATSKWDPATGLGTPKFNRWVEFFVNDTTSSTRR